jgi:hypothetical protein
MHALLHLVSVILLLPGLFLSIAVALFSRATAQKSLVDFFFKLLEEAGNLLQWGLLVVLALLVLIVGAGFSNRFRWLAGLVVASLAILSAALLIGLSSSPVTFDNMVFLFPGFISLSIGAWLAFIERPRIHSAANAT